MRKVKGHATTEDGRQGAATQEDKDGNHREALEYAAYYNHDETYRYLKQQASKTSHVIECPAVDIRRYVCIQILTNILI